MNVDAEQGCRVKPLEADLLSRRYIAVSRGELLYYTAAVRDDGKIPILFDKAFYLDSYEDVRKTGIDPLEHYLGWGAIEGRMPTGDVRSGKLDPLVEALHRLDPNDGRTRAFDRDIYRQMNPDLASFDDQALTAHYENHGRGEGRVGSMYALSSQLCDSPREIPLDFDPGEYAEFYADLEQFKTLPVKALHHYMSRGRWEFRHYSLRAFKEDRSPWDSHSASGASSRDLYVKQSLDAIDREELPVKLIAFYLPQFHPIPENDEWWGEGFTEWTNVTKAMPNYEDHYQPRLPADLGFYDLRVADVMDRQAEMARRYGIYGFCYHYYWFGGRRLLEMPIERMLATGKPDFPFCLNWANENWTRRWDGAEQEVLIAQQHGDEDDVAVIRDLIRYFRHPNYIRIDGRPFLIIYRAGLLPNIENTVGLWREVCHTEGIGEIYLAMAATFEHRTAGTDPTAFGMDAIVEYPPHFDKTVITERNLRLFNSHYHWKVSDYSEFAKTFFERDFPAHVTRFRGIMPDWDNTARSQNNSYVFHGTSPEAYGKWLQAAIEQTMDWRPKDERLIFINAWNEWAEGAYLEPDRKYGFAYLAATREALEQAARKRSPKPSAAGSRPIESAVSERLRSSFARERDSAGPEPLVSIVIPMYGQLPYTLQCLESIAASPPSVPFEIIVVDDGSPDDPAETLRSIEGVRLVAKPENQGFIRACNDAAGTARGEYLCFLNNDTEVKPGWLDSLVRTFRDFPGAGLAGSKLVYPDGILQEAGGIIWQDGSASNFGRGGDASLPVYNYAREVDYCSGASIMIPKSLFDESGGFDEYYVPAYCEDSDLALKVRSLGYRVVYQPHSVVVHHEGVTSGTDVTRSVKAWQPVNSKKLYRRWKDRLARHQAPGGDIDVAKDRMAQYRVLVLDHATPAPDQDAGSVTVFNTMLLLRDMAFQVTFIAEFSYLYTSDYTAALQRLGIETPDCLSHESIERHLEEVGDRYDLVLVFRAQVSECYDNLHAIRRLCPRAKIQFWTLDLCYLRVSREAKILRNAAKKKEALRLKKVELASIREADATVVHSPVERDMVMREIPETQVHLVPLILDVPGTRAPFGERQDIAFLGGYRHPPNVDAVHYFVNDIMPCMRKKLPGVRFHIAGSNVPEEIRKHDTEPDIVVTGHVADLQSLFDRIRISVAPLRYGAGVKGKIGVAMSAGLPVVTTSPGAEGMELTDGENVLIADDPEVFADALARLYNDEELWTQLSESGLEFARNTWGEEAAWQALAATLSGMGLPEVKRGRHPLRLYSPAD